MSVQGRGAGEGVAAAGVIGVGVLFFAAGAITVFCVGVIFCAARVRCRNGRISRAAVLGRSLQIIEFNSAITIVSGI